MQKKKGFSLIELLVVTGIVAILVTISIPGFSRMRSRVNFQGEIDTIFNQILEVRMNALTEKMCDDKASEKWIFGFNATTSTISCKNNIEEVPVQTYDTQWHQSHTIELDDVPKVTVRIEFLPDTSQSFIPYGDPIGTNQGDNAKILFTHDSGEQKTICFNRIMGIPELSSGDTDCTP